MTTSTTTNDLVQIQKRSNTVLAILAAIAFAYATAPAYSQAMITAGFDTRPDLADGGNTTHTVLPAGRTAQQLVGMGVDISDTGYFWWSDGTVTQGTGKFANDLARAQRFDLPFGKRVSEIVGMAIDENGDVYTYFNDYTVSIGDPFDLDSIDRPRPYLLPLGYVPNNIIGVGMMNDDVILFFRNGTHHYNDISDYRNFTVTASDYQRSTFTLPAGYNTSNIAGMDFADSDGRLYTMFVTRQQNNNTSHRTTRHIQTSHNVQQGGVTHSTTRRTTQNGFTTTSHHGMQHGFNNNFHTTHLNSSHNTRHTNSGITIAKDGWALTLPNH